MAAKTQFKIEYSWNNRKLVENIKKQLLSEGWVVERETHPAELNGVNQKYYYLFERTWNFYNEKSINKQLVELPNINKYIDWYKLWEENVFLDIDLDTCDEKLIPTIKNFLNDKSVSLDTDECCVSDGKLMFSFSETGGQNESDTQGWYREYLFIVDKDFMVTNVIYTQG